MCKFVSTLIVGGQLGSYFGELTKKGATNGVGVFIVGEKQVIVGQFENGNLACNIPFIQIDRT